MSPACRRGRGVAVVRRSGAWHRAALSKGDHRCPIRSSTTSSSRRRRSGWAAPPAPSPGGDGVAGARPADRAADRPTARSARGAGAMTVRGSITATAVLFVLLLISATIGFLQTPDAEQLPDGTLGVLLPRPRHGRRDRRLRRRHRPATSSRRGRSSSARSTPSPRASSSGRSPRPTRTLYDGIVLQAAGATLAVFGVMLAALQHPDHQGHRQVPAHRHLRHPRHHGAVPGVVRDLAVRRRDPVHQRAVAVRHRCSACSSAASRR